MTTAGTKRAIDVAETRLQIREDTQTCLCTPDEVAECGLIICSAHSSGKRLLPLPKDSDIAFWNQAQNMGIIEPLVEVWNDLKQPPVRKLAVIWNALVDFVAEITRLGFKAEAMQANA